MADSLLIVAAPAAGLRLAVCGAPLLSREAAQRHGLAPGSAAALAQALAGSLLLAATDRPAGAPAGRVDVQLECGGPLRGLLVDADGSGAVRGLVRVGSLDRGGGRVETGLAQATRVGASAEAALEGQGGEALLRFDAGPLLSGAKDDVAGMLSILRAAEAAPGTDPELHRALVPFAGADLGAGISAFLRNDREGAGEMALEVLYRHGEPLAAVAGAMVLPAAAGPGNEAAPAEELGARLRAGLLREALARAETGAPGNAHALAQELASRLGLGPLLVESELRPRFLCRCSRERVVRALSTLGAVELRDMAERDGGAEASCDFCAASYRISARELLELASAA
ncbi:MAG TPA: Hsp33 family molecular chaperone HslO [Myxococcales bacterium]|jgi:molecular chaperone Hsp33|nr:Hsp33 family molecular chaperone HslO [Myxococcales bacterium]